MSTTAYNLLYASGPADDMRVFIDRLEASRALPANAFTAGQPPHLRLQETFFPIPATIPDREVSYWLEEHWGSRAADLYTSWDGDPVIGENGGTADLEFSSTYDPPLAGLRAISDALPTLRLELYCAIASSGAEARMVWQGGEEISFEERELWWPGAPS